MRQKCETGLWDGSYLPNVNILCRFSEAWLAGSVRGLISVCREPSGVKSLRRERRSPWSFFFFLPVFRCDSAPPPHGGTLPCDRRMHSVSLRSYGRPVIISRAQWVIILTMSERCFYRVREERRIEWDGGLGHARSRPVMVCDGVWWCVSVAFINSHTEAAAASRGTCWPSEQLTPESKQMWRDVSAEESEKCDIKIPKLRNHTVSHGCS